MVHRLVDPLAQAGLLGIALAAQVEGGLAEADQSAERVVGPNRFLYALTDTQNAPIAAPDLSTTVRFYDLPDYGTLDKLEADERIRAVGHRAGEWMFERHHSMLLRERMGSDLEYHP